MSKVSAYSQTSVVSAGDAGVDLALFERIVARDQRALAELYDRHSRLLYGLILRILRDRSEAEEVLQEVFVQAWARADTFRGTLGSPVAWLIGIARHRAIDRLRANASRFREAEAAIPTNAHDNPESRARLREDQRAVARALDALAREQRVLIEQAYFLGLTQTELAERHHLPLGTVKTRIRAGMQALRRTLSQRGPSQ